MLLKSHLTLFLEFTVQVISLSLKALPLKTEESRAGDVNIIAAVRLTLNLTVTEISTIR